MGVKWTEEQKKVISLRDRNILVSAAAGSGKTAVLVQRILSRITDRTRPADIDRLLIMTFTRAAAGEMRERLSAALEQALLENPENEHLQRQVTLIHTAQITTIDGFCAYIIKNYFHLIGLDPGYRTADEGELKLMKEDVLKELLEDAYASQEPLFHELVECYASGRTDEGLKDLILRVYHAAMSHPEPEEWLRSCLDVYDMEDVSRLRESEWMDLLWESVEEGLAEAELLAEEARDLCLGSHGPYFYEEALKSDLLFIRQVREAAGEKDYDGVGAYLRKPDFVRLSNKKDEDVYPEQKEEVKALREEAKEILKDLGSRCFPALEEENFQIMKRCRGSVEVLTELTLEFMERFAEKKREKNLLDFTDMEHFALAILREKGEDGQYRASQAARELSEKYEEVLIDEYQDSNLVQELLTTLVSGWVNGRKNIFMVGDVKQSIYRFRLAKPELFMEKYKTYSPDDSREQRIDLHKNFRSRPQVLESVNFIFRQIMGEDLGGVAYDDAAALYPGADFPEGADSGFLKTEILLVEKDDAKMEEGRGETARELEALAVAQRILRMVGTEKVTDRATGKYRPLEYGDIVVLLRTASGWAETFAEVFASKGIPAYTAAKTGYFSALEVVTVLNFLRVCDNPLQDIPLAGVLRSPIVGLTAQELGEIRCGCPGGKLYESICGFLENGQMYLFPEMDEKELLKEKLRFFLDLLNEIRDMAAYTPVHQLILYVLRKTGYGDYARAMPDGQQRSANLHMLVEKALEYEKTSYRGLFNFIRYIENLQKYEVDFGEVNIAGEGASAVQIMTIHKSKGLEFPVVIAAGMGKQFNFQDMNARLLLHPDLGIGTDAVLPEKRLIIPTLYKQMVRRKLMKESLGEELRVLYVALTRAREKLILSGIVGNLEKQLQLLKRYRNRQEELLSAGMRMKGKNYWSYVLPALAGHRCMDELYREYGIPVDEDTIFYHAEAEFEVHRITWQDLAGEEVYLQTDAELRKDMLMSWDAAKIYDADIRRELEERFGYVYPHDDLREIPAKVSVSELKKRSYAGEYDREEDVFWEPDIIPLIPAFMAEAQEEYAGAARGTAYHRVMECLDYRKISAEEIYRQIRAMTEQKKLEQAEADCINAGDIEKFVGSALGQRMARAAERGDLYREQPFVISVPASMVDEKWQGAETVLVQGIIDAYFQEEGELVLVDYKTDRVAPGEEKRLVSLYHTQLEDYASALERLMKKKVKEKYIYSFTLGKAILLQEDLGI